MTASFHLPFTIYHSPFIAPFPFTNAVENIKCELKNDNLLKIDTCKLNITDGGGA